MRKILLLSLAISAHPALTFAQDVANDLSLDFEVDGITYTVIDEAARTCKTKDGTMEKNDQGIATYKYGNTVSGALTIPATVNRNGDQEQSFSVVEIGQFAFQGTTSVNLPSTITAIGAYAFVNNQELTKINLPEGLTQLGAYAFYYCITLSDITLPSSLTAIPDYAFAYCYDLQDVSLPREVTSIGNSAFIGSGITSITISENVTSIGTRVFEGCHSLKEANLPENMVVIPSYMFRSCSSLTSIEIPASVTQIASYAFYNCTNLRAVECANPVPPALSDYSFNLINSAATLEVLKTSLDAYQKNTLWKNSFATITAIPTPATGVTLDKYYLTLSEGLSGQLTAYPDPLYSTDEITWTATSTPAGVVTVDNTGKVTSHTPGTATVIAQCGDYSASCVVTVNTNPSASIKITPPTDIVYAGATATFTATVRPSTITSPVVWSSSNTDVATIDETTGEMTALSPGATIITAVCDNLSAKYAINVYSIEAQEITLDNSALSLVPGDYFTLTATVSPDNATDKTVNWTSSDETVAVVADGTVTALAPGTATITATCGLVTASCVVTVNAIAATGIELSNESVTLKVNQSQQITASVNPSNATDKTVTWTTADASIATVSLDGLITAVAIGNTSVTATCGDVTATCLVTVEPTPADEVTISMTSLTLKATQSQQLTASVPEDTTDPTITWSSSDTSVAEVTSDGLVTAISVGSSTITATCGAVSATCEVTVIPTPAEQITLDTTVLTVNVGKTAAIQATVSPETVTDATVTWTVDNSNVAEVTDGTVTALAPGNAIVTATCGDVFAICAITVVNPATSITLNFTQLDLKVGEIEDLIETVEPEGTTDTVSWNSSDTDVAVVDQNGIVEALTAGETDITVTCGEVSATCHVTVSDIQITLTLNNTELKLKVGESETLEATVEPEGTTDSVQWVSEDNEVATVDSNGTVTAVALGETTVYAVIGNSQASCSVTVVADETDGIESLFSDKTGSFVVYSLQGIKLLETKQKEELKNLAPGIYIINNKKIYIK